MIIKAAFTGAPGGVTYYEDIYDLEIDPKSCAGVDFIQQEGRVCSFGMIVDDWINTHLINAEKLAHGYIPVRCSIYFGATKHFSGVVNIVMSEVTNHDGEFKTIKLVVADALYLMLDYAEGVQVTFNRGSGTLPLAMMGSALTTIRNTMDERIRYGIDSSGYEFNNWYPYYLPGTILLDWLDTGTMPVPEYSYVEKRYFVLYEISGVLYLEYVLFDTLTIGVEPSKRIDYYQHFYWLKWSISGTTLTLLSSSGAQFRESFGFVDVFDEAHITALIAKFPKLYDDYAITAENGISNIRVDDTGYVIIDSKLFLAYHPSVAVNVVPVDGEETTIEVEAYNVVRDACMLLCAYLDATTDSILATKNKINYPAAEYYEIGANEICGEFVRRYTDNGTMSIDASYLVNGDKMQAALDGYYKELMGELFPYQFEVPVLRGVHSYSVGDAVTYDGYNMMVKAIDDDLSGLTVVLQLVGGEA